MEINIHGITSKLKIFEEFANCATFSVFLLKYFIFPTSNLLQHLYKFQQSHKHVFLVSMYDFFLNSFCFY